jgi:cyclase
LTQLVVDNTTIPVIASGGAGKLEHFTEAIKIAGANAVLAASVFHFREFTIFDVKKELEKNHIPVRFPYKSNS